MTGSKDDKCKWCGRLLGDAQPQPISQPRTEVSAVQVPAAMSLDEEERIGRRNYIIFGITLLVLSACL